MISSAYSYYLTQYGNKTHAKYDTHTRKQLKNTYGKVLKINSRTPSYKIDFSLNAQKYAIDLKENARELGYIAKELSDAESGEMTFKKSARSSNPAVVEAEYIGGSDTPDVSAFEVRVSQMASCQVNTGNYLQPGRRLLKPDTYSFDLETGNLVYEFEFDVKNGENNQDVQNKISRLVNRANIGLHSKVLTDSLGNTAISITSENTGITGTRPTIFNITSENSELMTTLGLDRVTDYPSNAVYSVNGNEQSAQSNEVTINKIFSLRFHQTTQEAPVTISVRTDGESIVDSIDELISGYNNLVSVAVNNNDRFSGNEKLRREFTSIARAYKETLASSGLNIAEDGTVHVDRQTILSAAEQGCLNRVFSSLNDFKKAMQRKAENIALNPMDYVNNKIIAYKNPQRPINDPYNLSAYTGMMFNGYI